jgi:hypothetical protein
MRAAPVLFLVLIGACGGDDDAVDAPDAGGVDGKTLVPDAAPTGAKVLVELTRCPTEVTLSGGFVYWRDDDMNLESQILRASLEDPEPELLWTGAPFEGSGFQVAEDALYWQGAEWPVRLDLATGRAAPLIKRYTSFVRVVDRSRVFVVMPAQTTGTGVEIAEVHGDGRLSTIDRYEDYDASVWRVYAGPGHIYWTMSGLNVDKYVRLRDVVGGGGYDYWLGDGGDDLIAVASDAVRRYFVIEHPGATELAIGGLTDQRRYAIPNAITGVAPDATDPWAAWIVVSGALRHATDGQVGEPVLDDVGALASDDGALVAAVCDPAGARLVRWYP